MPHFLVAESETADERDARRKHTGKSSGETYAATLAQLRPDAKITIVAPADDDADIYDSTEIAAFDAPYPGEEYKAGARQFPALVPASPDDPAAPANKAAPS